MAGAQILVVEDNEKNMKLFRDVLQASGVPHPGGDDRRAGGRAGGRARGPISCSWTSSFRTSTASRRSAGCARTSAPPPYPVLALTAQAMDGDRERFLAAGFDGYLSKPVNIVELVDTVEQHCDGSGR